MSYILPIHLVSSLGTFTIAHGHMLRSGYMFSFEDYYYKMDRFPIGNNKTERASCMHEASIRVGNRWLDAVRKSANSMAIAAAQTVVL